MDAIDAIMGRRSIRHYTDEPVAREQIDTLLRAAMAAPSAGNQQRWRFVVVTDRERLDRLSGATPYSGMLRGAPLAIAVCADTTEEKHAGYWVQDCSAAMENLLLAAHAIGLGACWLGYHPRDEREASGRELLGLPDHVRVLGVASVGHPAEGKPPSDRYDESFVHMDRW